jgi:nucleotide-binding universal stress UspA family protein
MIDRPSATSLTTAASAASRGHGKSAHQAPGRLCFLVVVDGRECTNRVIDFVAAVSQGRTGTEAVVLNVQDLRPNARLRGYDSFKLSEIEDHLINEVGGPIVNSASSWLQKAGVMSVPKVKIGDPVSIILDAAAENTCDVIVVGEPRPHGIRRWVSAATRLPLVSARLAGLMSRSVIPLVVVK